MLMPSWCLGSQELGYTVTTTKGNAMSAIGCNPYSVHKCITNCSYEIYTMYLWYLCRTPEDWSFTCLSINVNEGLVHFELKLIEQQKYFFFGIPQKIDQYKENGRKTL